MDCRCRKLSLFFCKFLSAVGVLEQDCRYIFGNFGAMSLVAKTPWKASLEPLAGHHSGDRLPQPYSVDRYIKLSQKSKTSCYLGLVKCQDRVMISIFISLYTSISINISA